MKSGVLTRFGVDEIQKAVVRRLGTIRLWHGWDADGSRGPAVPDAGTEA